MRYLFVIVLFLGLCFTACEDWLEVPDISAERVQLLAPSDSTLVLQNNVTFSWNEVYEAKQYHVQVAAPNFNQAAQIVVDTLVVIDSAFIGTRLTRKLANSDYEWRVKAMNSGYETEYSLNQFTVESSDN